MHYGLKYFFASLFLMILSACGTDNGGVGDKKSTDRDKPVLPVTLASYMNKNTGFSKP